MIARRPAVLLGLVLGACSPDLPGPSLLPEATYTPPAPPTEQAIITTIPGVVAEAKLVTPVQISAARQNDHSGPGNYYVCLREANPPPDKRQRYYAVFFNSDTYKGSRLSVVMDECETQTFGPLPTAAPTPPAPNAKPAGHKATRGPTQ